MSQKNWEKRKTILDVNDPQFLPLWQEMEKSLETAWQALLKVMGCVECARLELVQRLRSRADSKNTEIIGIDWINENSMKEDQSADPPMEKDGISRVCKNCQEPPPEGAIRFFKHGRDELLRYFCKDLLQSVEDALICECYLSVNWNRKPHDYLTGEFFEHHGEE